MNSFKIKLINLFVISLFAIPAGCDEAELQDQNSDIVDAKDDAKAADDMDPKVAPEDSIDEFELSLDEDVEQPADGIDDFTASPRPTALCEGYGPGAYCWTKCGNGVWYKLSQGPYGGCTAAGAAACGGAWNHRGSCWGT